MNFCELSSFQVISLKFGALFLDTLVEKLVDYESALKTWILFSIKVFFCFPASSSTSSPGGDECKAILEPVERLVGQWGRSREYLQSGSSRPCSCSPFSQLLLLSACPALKEKLPLGTSVTPTSVLPLAQLKSSEPHGSKSLKQQFQHRELHRNPQNVPKNLHSCIFVPFLALRDHKPTLKWILSQSNWDKLIAMFVHFT